MIFMGPLCPGEREVEMIAQIRVMGSNAANCFQWNIIDGLCDNLGRGFTVINALNVGTWPKYHRRLILRDRQWDLHGVPCHEVGCINLPFLKQWTRFLGARRLVRALREEEVLLCTTYMPFLWALQSLDPSNRLTVIVTDLPEYADMHRVSPLRKGLRRVHNRLVHRFLRRADRFVLLTEQMAQRLNVGERPYIVMEGIYREQPPAAPPPRRERAILYTGRLNQRYGIGLLLDAFSMMEDEEVELWICGSGEMEVRIRDAASKDHRIRYFGFLPREEALALQRRASILVNPRQNTEDYTRCSFPSKTMEYLASGTPVLMYRLGGIPAEYDQYLHYVPGDRQEDLRDAIAALLDQDTVRQSEAARAFILTHKNAAAQAARILELMK